MIDSYSRTIESLADVFGFGHWLLFGMLCMAIIDQTGPAGFADLACQMGYPFLNMPFTYLDVTFQSRRRKNTAVLSPRLAGEIPSVLLTLLLK